MAKEIEVDEQPDEQITLTKAQLTELGLGSIEEITAKTKELQKTKQDNVTLENMAKDLMKSQTEFMEMVKVATADKQAELDADKFDDATKSKMADKFRELDPKDPKRKELFDSFAKDYGPANAELILTGNEITKSLMRPISKNTKNGEELRDFQNAWDKTQMLTALWQGINQGAKGGDKVDVNWRIALDAAQTLEKQGVAGANLVVKGINEAMDTATATEGLEWLPTQMSGTLAEDVWMSLRVASIFRRYTMPSKSYDIPIRTARALGYRMAEATTNSQYFTNLATAHSMETAKVTLTANKLATLNFISDELEEDAIIDTLSLMREDVIYGLNYIIEDAVLNGSTGATLDGALWSGTTDGRSTWNGLRSAVNSAEKTDLSTFNLNGLRNGRKPLGKYANTTDDLAYVVAPWTHIEMLKLSEVVTIDKYGPHATIMSGEIGKLDGIPIIISPLVYGPATSTGLNASGVYDGSTTTKTMMLLVNNKGWAFGDRRMVRVESERQALAGQRFVLSTWRGDFKKMFPSVEPLVAVYYNMAP